MKLYYSDVLAPRRVCALARHLKSPVEFVYLDLAAGEHKTPNYLALNPNGRVPTLVDGETVIWEADAINCHLSKRAEADLWPRETDRQVEAIRWLSWNSQHFVQHGGALYFEHIIKARFHIGPPDPAEVEQALAQFRRHAAVLDAHLERRRWLVGEQLSVADFAVGVTLPYAEAARIPLEEFPAIARWHDRLNELEGWREPWPVRELAPA